MKLTIIHNPTAGGARNTGRVLRFLEQLKQQGHIVTMLETNGPGHATELAQQAVKAGTEVIIIAGGDGTVNEAIQGMAGGSVPLAVYPVGTTNVWCKQVRMPRNPRQAAAVIGGGSRRAIDLGRTDSRYFLLMTGIGFDGEITHALDLEQKKRLGKLAYAFAAVRVGLKFGGAEVSIMLDGQREVKVQTSLIIFTNTERYAVMKLAQEAQLDDGRLEMLVFQTSNLWSKLARAVSIITNRSRHDHKIQRYSLQNASIQASPRVAMQIDGDPLGYVGLASVKIECIPQALQVIVPHRAPEYLFCR